MHFGAPTFWNPPVEYLYGTNPNVNVAVQCRSPQYARYAVHKCIRNFVVNTFTLMKINILIH